MFLDEKIALLEKANRQAKMEEAQKEALQNELKLEEEAVKTEPTLTLEEIRVQIQQGQAQIKDDTLEFEIKSYFNHKLVLPIMPQFFDEVKEEKEAVLFVNDEKGISLICTYLPEEMKAQTIEEAKKEMETNLTKLGLYAECIKEESLQNLSYICSNMPTGKGTIYNILFWIHKDERRIVGNLNCLEKDKDIYGILLEAIVQEIDTLV
ncbi:hypothetical protein KQI88_15650 [Alkaliphilus sp. MSJ-5]|uniref:Uncharacterized protein n=1 Tax=Alkaliphilus flagellatus TaxID=2841507 RepID=A0ABS6G800_9FIRM|nr:hypothetical protein [Alkaliphilus flagellatus]MBU5677852.1 hypothetical protein [Alkaliphilus flagellatus]